MRNSNERLPRLRASLRHAGQEHVLRFWDELDGDAQERLLTQLEGIDFDLLRQLASGEGTVGNRVSTTRCPAPVLRVREEPAVASRKEARAHGEELLRRGKVGAFLVAGGQGSRLGFAGPKGCYPFGPLSERTLFDLHCSKLRALGDKYGVSVPLYVMTSEANDAATRDFMTSHDFFGLAEEDVLFLPQAMLPALDADGRLILETEGKVFESPNGHGGAYLAFASGGGLADATARGIEHIFYFQVDNPLVRVADPFFVGLHALEGAEMSLKVLAKTGPAEKMGVVVLEDDRPHVVEYSDLSREESEELDDTGDLRYWAGSIAIHAFTLGFMRRVAEGGITLPYHVAKKAISGIDGSGQKGEIAGRKFETFVFDALPFAERFLNVEVVRSEEFAPVKNLEGVDSVATARELVVEEHRRWLSRVGIETTAGVEISPLAALDWPDLVEPLAAWKGKTFQGPVRVERGADGVVRFIP